MSAGIVIKLFFLRLFFLGQRSLVELCWQAVEEDRTLAEYNIKREFVLRGNMQIGVRIRSSVSFTLSPSATMSRRSLIVVD